MLSPSPPRSPHEGHEPSTRRLFLREGAGASASKQAETKDLERERRLTAQERLSWARFEGALPDPSLADATATPYDRNSLGVYTPPKLPHSGHRTRRSLEEELHATVGSRSPAIFHGSDALADLEPFDQALFALSSELDPWVSGRRAHLSMCDYREFRFVAESFRRWRMLAADEKARHQEYSLALRRYKAAVKHHVRDLLAKGWVGWEVGESSTNHGFSPSCVLH